MRYQEEGAFMETLCMICYDFVSILCLRQVRIEVELLLQNRPPLFLWSLSRSSSFKEFFQKKGKKEKHT